MGLRRTCYEETDDIINDCAPGGVAVVRTVAPTFTWGKKERRDLGARFSARKKAFSRASRRAHNWRRPLTHA
jgi:Na+-translocating ferredoxin:NAD+ oxidoreductase RNF subunit RnfB